MSNTPRRLWPRVFAWIIAASTLFTGLILVAQRDAVLWSSTDADGTITGTSVDLTGGGLALLCTGIVCVVALLIVEMIVPLPPRPMPLGDVLEQEAAARRRAWEPAETLTADEVAARLKSR